MQKIIFALLTLGIISYGSEYVFSYHLTVKNSIILKEKYYFSPAMISQQVLQKVKNPHKKCTISHLAENEKEFLQDYKDKILECFFYWGVKLEDITKNNNLQSQSITFLNIPATRIVVEFESGIATIYKLKEMR
ncbi:MAG: hypothetical protein K2I63_04415 [Helicobacter sp.]|nr:hypothetical protein [Helicobacter sp.]